jgi:chromate transporter
MYQAVEHQHWLTGAQMIDGSRSADHAGPLIMSVVAFVGFVGG